MNFARRKPFDGRRRPHLYPLLYLRCSPYPLHKPQTLHHSLPGISINARNQQIRLVR